MLTEPSTPVPSERAYEPALAYVRFCRTLRPRFKNYAPC